MSEKEDDRNNAAGVAGALLLGIAAGTVLGIMLAPTKGSETRKTLCSWFEDLGDKRCHTPAQNSGNDDPEEDRPV